jgi:hypothetical protein
MATRAPHKRVSALQAGSRLSGANASAHLQTVQCMALQLSSCSLKIFTLHCNQDTPT